MDEYIKREEAIEAVKHAWAKGLEPSQYLEIIPAADVATVQHGRCDVCSGKNVLTQDADNGYILEIDSEQQEASLWYGDNCLAVFHIDFCPVCGCCMDGGAE